MKLLIIGCGSIGRRHAKNAKTLGSELILCDRDESLIKKLQDDVGDCPWYTDYIQAVTDTKPSAAVIATPSSLHIKMAAKLAGMGVHLLIEKPLSDSLECLQELKETVEKNKITTMMAHSYRFHEGLVELKKMLDNNIIGTVYHVYAGNGWYLPDWHIHEDYRKEYSARKSMGGGVVLTNLSHNFDTFHWLFGEIEEIQGWNALLSPLELDVEDASFSMIRTKKNVIIMNVSDFLSRLPRNIMQITGSHGSIEADFTHHKIKMWRVQDKRFPPGDPRVEDRPDRMRILEDGVQYDTSPDEISYSFEGNYRYLKEMEYFLDKVREGVLEFDLDLNSGIHVMGLLFHQGVKNIEGSSEKMAAFKEGEKK